MFPALGLFQRLACPDKNCERQQCLFSHANSEDLPPPVSLDVLVPAPVPTAAHQPPPQPDSSSSSRNEPAKRQLAQTSITNTASFGPHLGEPPRKLQRVGTVKRPIAVPTASQANNGVPVLRVNAAQSLVPIPVRQTMLKTLYDHFATLYSSILHLSPSLAAEHALKQEEEVYKKSSKLTYRNAVIQCIAALKRRSPPSFLSHPSVGTEDELKTRIEQAKSIQALTLTREHLEPLILTREDMEKWGYILDVPPSPGGEQPSLEGKVAKCERCAQPFQVSREGPEGECVYHWGKPQTTRAGGEKVRVYTCCSRPVAESEGCVRGRHVFYESTQHVLHARHPFSSLRPPSSRTEAQNGEEKEDTALDIAAMDCEMIYTTGGLRVARVSVIDARGNLVFDEFIKMDEDVHVIDYITRFSGITPELHSRATLPSASIRKSLDALLNTETILVGHALDNDLKTMRIVHHRCVDTAILFPHKAGVPYRRALRDLVREKLGRLIQTGDATTGHSSAEDAAASLDLVRWYILNRGGQHQPQSTNAGTKEETAKGKPEGTQGSGPGI